MLVIPVSLFFVGRWYLFAGWENTDVYSAIIAILAVSISFIVTQHSLCSLLDNFIFHLILSLKSSPNVTYQDDNQARHSH